MKSYIRIAPDVEYFTDYDRFREAQICCAVAEDGTSLFSRIENRRFMHTARHDLSERVIELLCRRYIVKYAHCTMADRPWNDLPTTPENCKL